MPRVQFHGASLSNAMTFFVTLLCASQVYASCSYSEDSTYSYCTPTFSTSSIIGVAIGGIILMIIVGIIGRIHRRRRLRQRAAYMPGGTTIVYAPSNSYGIGRPQTNVFHPYPNQAQGPPGLQSSRPVPGQMNSLNRQGITPAPSFPQPSHSSSMTHSTRTRSPTMPSPTHHSYPNQALHVSPPSSPGSTHLPPAGFPPSHSSPSTYSRVSADPSAVHTPSINVTPAASPPPHATSVGRPSPQENMEMRPLTVKTEVANDEAPPAYTPV
ncbi:hypothetical protein EDB19DRAFT_2037214 [Suillus lakei]|nr:hypothetical protein EDB19DRAFT_2037214 [Suillus lakei]